MGLFSFLTNEVAVDLGTANTIIIHNDKIVVDEPSIVAIDKKTGKLIALGNQARSMHGKTHSDIETIRPLRDGVIADFNAAELMIRGMLKMITKKSGWFAPSLRMVICIPSGSTEVEVRAVRDSSEQAGAREVYLIYEPMAAAIGIGLDVEAPDGSMVVDIGGGTSEIAVISLGGIVCNKSIRTAGDEFNDDILEHMRYAHNIRVGERTAEDIKINVGAALSDIEDPPPEYLIKGPHQTTAYPLEIPVNHKEIAHALDKSITKLETAILQVLEEIPPELYADVYRKGIFLTGGGGLLRGLDKRLSEKFEIPFHVSEDPLHAVARGTGIALKHIDKFPFLMR